MRKINILGKKGQNTAEYAILIGLVVAAALAMQTYVKRGVQGRVHDASDRYYDNITTGAKGDWDKITTTGAASLDSKQYEPEGLSSQSTQNTLEDYEKSDMAKGGTVTRESIQRSKQAEDDYQRQDYK